MTWQYGMLTLGGGGNSGSGSIRLPTCYIIDRKLGKRDVHFQKAWQKKKNKQKKQNLRLARWHNVKVQPLEM